MKLLQHEMQQQSKSRRRNEQVNAVHDAVEEKICEQEAILARNPGVFPPADDQADGPAGYDKIRLVCRERVAELNNVEKEKFGSVILTEAVRNRDDAENTRIELRERLRLEPRVEKNSPST